jgi:hypothetical protein
METNIKEFSYPENAIEFEDGFVTDTVVTSIINQFVLRAQFGKQKYGTDLDRKDLSTLDWIEHAKQELMDGILYLEKLKQELSVKK